MIEGAAHPKINPCEVGASDLVLAPDAAEAAWLRAQLLGERKAAHTARVLSWRAFVLALYDAQEHAPPRLTDAQEVALWRRQAGDAGLAAAAREAWFLARAYGIAENAWVGSEETERCRAWAEAVRKKAQARGRATSACALDALISDPPAPCLRGEHLSRVVLAPNFTPPAAVQQLLVAWQKEGMAIAAWEDKPASEARLVAHACEDEFAEAEAAARLVKKWHDARKRVAVLALDEEARARVAMTLARPPFLLAPAMGEIALGETPRGRAARDWLDAAIQGRIAADALVGWSWLVWDEEAAEPWIARWRKAPSWSLAAVETALAEKAPPFSQGVRALRADEGKRMPSAWAEHWHEALLALGVLFADDAGRAPEELHAAAKVREGLLQLAELDAVLGEIGQREAAAELARLWEAMRVPAGGEVPVLAFADGAGLGWDAAIVVAADEARLPWGARPLPFAPVEAQREVGIPNASAELARKEAQRLWDALLARTGEVVALFARRRGEEELGPSPFIRAGLAEAEPAASVAVADEPKTQSFADAPRLAALGAWPGGGAWLLSEFAACPFRGQMRARWNLGAYEVPPEGASPLARGTLVHAALAAFWKKVRTSAELARLVEDGRLDAVVREAVDAALAREHVLKSELAPQGREKLKEHERTRMVALVRDWLLFEHRSRTQPFCVVVCEEKTELEVASVRIPVRVDRVDEVEGRRIVLDYKTGAPPSLSQWAMDPVLDWQLPLYALIHEADAVAHAAVRRGEFKFSGVAEGDFGIPGLKRVEVKDRRSEAGRFWDDENITTMNALRAFWRERLENLVERFMNGEAVVRPARESCCEGCDLIGVCRVEERV